MNILLDGIDGLPETVDINGRDYEIRSDFRYSVMFEILMLDNDVPEREKVPKALSIYFPIIPRDRAAAVDKMLWFYKCGKEESGQKQRVAARRSKERIYSFDYDDDYIYAAFMAQYRIDLATEPLHWWAFRALFRALSSDNEFVKIMEYRGIEIKDNMTKEQKAFYRRMKRIHALPVSKTEDQRQAAIEKALIEGGDLTGLL